LKATGLPFRSHLPREICFLQGRKIHEAIDLAQEGLHSIHRRKQKAVTLKVDLSKGFDKVSWLYIRLLLIQVGFQAQFHFLDYELYYLILLFHSNKWLNFPFFKSERGILPGVPSLPSPLSPSCRGTKKIDPSGSQIWKF
jgi:hypothetical protein